MKVELNVIDQRLDVGDYQLGEDPMGVVIERKASLQEISKNCITKDNKRFKDALDRLAQARQPYLMVEGTPTNFLQYNKYVDCPEVVLDMFIKLLTERNIQLIMMPTGAKAHRNAFANWVARLLVNGYRWTNGSI